MHDWLLVMDDGAGDVEAGATAALYKDKKLAWSGYSNDQAENIVAAILGEDVRTVLLGSPPLRWPEEADPSW